MELVEVALPTRLVIGATRVFPLHHSHTELTRGLEPDEQLIILDRDGEYHAAVVEDIAFTLDDTVYVVRTGVRLPEEHALKRLAAMPTEPSAAAVGAGVGDIEDIIDLIGEMLRRGRD